MRQSSAHRTNGWTNKETKIKIPGRCNPNKFDSNIRLGSNEENYKTSYNHHSEWIKIRR